MTLTIFLDEAGNTGGHMTNAEQPAFVLASHQIVEAESRALLVSHFPKSQAAEFKHSNVRKYKASREGMVALIKTLKQESAPIAIYAVHKRFALFQRLFDYLVEPVMHDGGFNAYEGAFNIAATNVGYVSLTAILGEPFMATLLDLFETAVREKSPVHLARMWRHLEKAKKGQKGGVRQMLDMLLVGKLAGNRHFNALPDGALDLAMGTMMALIFHWRGLSAGPFEVIHDQSTSLAANRAIWDWLSSPEQQEATLGFGDFRDALLPLNVTKTEFARSHDHAGLQLADLLAGGNQEICRFVLGDKSNAEYARALMDAGLDEVANNIWPDIRWKPPTAPGDAGAIDPLDFIVNGPLSK